MIAPGVSIPPKEFYAEVAKGLIPNHSLLHKFGHGVATTTLSPIGTAMTYQMPTTAQALEFVSSSVNDTSAGSGAQEITIIGLDSNWTEVTQTIATNGTTAVALPTNLTRLYRWYVSKSGTYATSATGSHAGTLTIRAAGAGATWSQIALVGTYGLGQSEIGFYTIPLGKTGYLLTKHIDVQSTKVLDLFMMQRPIINDVSSPFTGTMRLVERETDAAGFMNIDYRTPKGPFVGPCDFGFMAKTAVATAEVSVEFEMLLVNT